MTTVTGASVQLRNNDLVNLLRPDFQGRNEPNFAAKSLVSMLRCWKAQRGLWYFGNNDSLNNVPDLTGQGRTLYDNGSTLRFTEVGPGVGCVDLTGSEYFERPDEVGLDITGTETQVATAYRGWTAGAWCRSDADATQGVLTKWDTTANRSYEIITVAGPVFRAQISNAGAAVDAAISSATITLGDWYFVCAVFSPSTYLRLYVGDTAGNFTYTEIVAGVPASIFSGTAPLNIGAINGASMLDGRVSIAWLCAGLQDGYNVRMVWEQTQMAFAGG